MDARRLSDAKSKLKRQATMDRSGPTLDDAAHPGSGGVLRAISVGHFDLKHVTPAHDASAPAIEAGTHIKESPAAAVFAEIKRASSKNLKAPLRVNDRSEPQIEKWPTSITTKPPAHKSVMSEIAQKKGTIEQFAEFNSHHLAKNIEEQGLTRPSLCSEIKSFKPFLDERADYRKSVSATEMPKADPEKQKHALLVDEIRHSTSKISEFTEYAARHHPEDNFRAAVNTSLINEIKMKRPSIDALTHLHRAHSAVAVE